MTSSGVETILSAIPATTTIPRSWSSLIDKTLPVGSMRSYTCSLYTVEMEVVVVVVEVMMMMRI